MNLNIVTFNIRCFGFDGDYFRPQPAESRIADLKGFLQKYFSEIDVFILQEIMDLTILDQILPPGFKFYSYPHTYERHMHIVLCCHKDFDFLGVQTIAGTALDETKSRPAIYGCLQKNQKPIAHIMGVHLKSKAEHSLNRLKQAKAIGAFIKDLDELPLIIAGDFNTHTKDKTGLTQDDVLELDDLFQKHFLQRQSHNKDTYVTSFESASLDHFWTSTQIKDLNVYDFNKDFKDLDDYFKKISDHLPVFAKVQL